MDSIVSFLRENLYSLWPLRVIDKGNQGILWRHDGTVKLLQPGWHFFWPRIWRVSEHDSEYQNTDTGTQGLTTKDDAAITISMNIGYSIADVSKLYTQYQHFDTSLINKARGYAAECIPLSTWKDIYTNPEKIAQEVLDRLQDDLGEESGCVLIEDVVLDQLVKAPALRLFQQTANTY
jgi:regulator of protease activity HflC (stomatin/prohibitin superfamily)